MSFLQLIPRTATCALTLAFGAALSGCYSSTTLTSERQVGSSQQSQSSITPSGGSLQVSPARAFLTLGQETALITSGGQPPYRYTVISGGGEISGGDGSITAFYRAARSPGQATIQAQDVLGNTALADIRIELPAPQSANDPNFAQQTSLTRIQAQAAWGIQTDCRNVLVAVLDTGITRGHPDLGPNVWLNPGEVAGNGRDDDNNGVADDLYGWNFSATGAGNANTADDNFHGTHVSGIIGAVGNNAIGISGVCWRASILPVKALDSEGAGSTSDLIAGIGYATRTGARVINASLGIEAGSSVSANELSGLRNAIDTARSSGVIVVAAAGNEGNDNDSAPAYPAAYPLDNIVAVAALAATDTLAGFSNYGRTSVDLAAPGASILSTFPISNTTGLTATNDSLRNANRAALRLNYEALSGTSMAAPLVSGALALLWSVEPDFTYAQVINRLLNSATTVPGLSNQVAGGRKLNLYRALYPQGAQSLSGGLR